MKRLLLIVFSALAWCGLHAQVTDLPSSCSPAPQPEVVFASDALLDSVASDALVVLPAEGEKTFLQRLTADSNNAAGEFNYKESKYWGRYTALRAVGWSCFGAGIGFFIGGMVGLIACIEGGDDALYYTSASLLFASPVLVAGSIPMLTLAYVNRRKAKTMKSMVNLDLVSIPQTSLNRNHYSAKGLGISLNF